MTREHDVSAPECLALAALLDLRAHEELAALHRRGRVLVSIGDRDYEAPTPRLEDTASARAALVLRAEADRLLKQGRGP